jgi:hypothetical protein
VETAELATEPGRRGQQNVLGTHRP